MYVTKGKYCSMSNSHMLSQKKKQKLIISLAL